MRHGLARARSRNLPSYLETMNQRNIAFYQRHDFKLGGERPVAGGGPMVWGMLCPSGAGKQKTLAESQLRQGV